MKSFNMKKSLQKEVLDKYIKFNMKIKIMQWNALRLEIIIFCAIWTLYLNNISLHSLRVHCKLALKLKKYLAMIYLLQNKRLILQWNSARM